MKRFAFRLERLRELRERAERERAAILGAAMREEDACADALSRAQRELEAAREQLASAPAAGPVPAGFLHSLDTARGAAEGRVDAAAESLVEASQRVDEERGLYTGARRDLRVLEKLKEKRFDAWRDRLSREEQKETDGVAARNHAAQGGDR